MFPSTPNWDQSWRWPRFPCSKRVCDRAFPIRQSRIPSASSSRCRCREKREMHTRVASRLDVGALRARPIFIMADGEKYFVIGQKIASTIRIDSGGIGNVVTVCLQPANHRILCGETPSRREARPRAVKGRL